MSPGYFHDNEKKLNLKNADDNYRKCADGKLEVYEVEPEQKKRLKGKYFNYINLLPTVDLSDFQIGQTYESHM